MKKLIWILIGIVVVVVVVLIGIFGYSNTCKTLPCGSCEIKILGIRILESWADCPLLVGGCAGVSLENQPACCENWARENEIIIPACVGGWVFDYNINQCVWNCDAEINNSNFPSDDCKLDNSGRFICS